MPRMTDADLYNFLAQSRLGVLGTIAEGNVPQSALVGIAVTADWELIFDTVKSSRKYRNLIARPACSFVIGWTGEQTVQYEGRAGELRGEELQRYQQIYFETWPECRSHLIGRVLSTSLCDRDGFASATSIRIRR